MTVLEFRERIASVELSVSESFLSFVLSLGVCEDRCHACYQVGGEHSVTQNIVQRLEGRSCPLLPFDVDQQVQNSNIDRVTRREIENLTNNSKSTRRNV